MGQKFSQKGCNLKETQVGGHWHPPTLYESRKELFPRKEGKGKRESEPKVYYNPTSREVGRKCRGEFPVSYRSIKRSTGFSLPIVSSAQSDPNLRLHALLRCLSDSNFFYRLSSSIVNQIGKFWGNLEKIQSRNLLS